MRKYIEFSIWNDLEERPATDDEIREHVRISIIGEGKAGIEVDDGYSVLAY